MRSIWPISGTDRGGRKRRLAGDIRRHHQIHSGESMAYTNLMVLAGVAGSPFTLSAPGPKVCRVDSGTKGLRLAPSADAASYDIEWIAVTAGAAAPADAYGEPVFGG